MPHIGEDCSVGIRGGEARELARHAAGGYHGRQERPLCDGQEQIRQEPTPTRATTIYRAVSLDRRFVRVIFVFVEILFQERERVPGPTPDLVPRYRPHPQHDHGDLDPRPHHPRDNLSPVTVTILNTTMGI